MHVLVIGATGFIGSAIVARLKAEGLTVAAASRSLGAVARRVPADRSLRLDLAAMAAPEDWLPYLEGVDAVINCAGVLQDGGGDSTARVHRDGPAALHAACERAGVRRIIHFSAMGADKESLSDFSRSKQQAEEELMRRNLDWTILRPSVVVGRAAYGGSALFRGLAALPVLPRLEKAGQIQIVQLDDVVETVVRLLRPEAPSRSAFDVAGPEPMRFEQVVACYRRWLGWPPAKVVGFPSAVMALAYAFGDLLGRLGWRPPIRSTARREMVRGAAGDPTPWMRATGIAPRSLDAALAAEPASVQERWFARLYLLKPLVLGIFALFWIMTGVVSLGPGFEIGEALMREGGAGALSGPSVIAGALADLVIGAGILYRRTSRAALLAALAISIFYVAAGTALLPRLWADPLGPMMKVWPILALNLVALAILDDR